MQGDFQQVYLRTQEVAPFALVGLVGFMARSLVDGREDFNHRHQLLRRRAVNLNPIQSQGDLQFNWVRISEARSLWKSDHNSGPSIYGSIPGKGDGMVHSSRITSLCRIGSSCFECTGLLNEEQLTLRYFEEHVTMTECSYAWPQGHWDWYQHPLLINSRSGAARMENTSSTGLFG